MPKNDPSLNSKSYPVQILWLHVRHSCFRSLSFLRVQSCPLTGLGIGSSLIAQEETWFSPVSLAVCKGAFLAHCLLSFPRSQYSELLPWKSYCPSLCIEVTSQEKFRHWSTWICLINLWSRECLIFLRLCSGVQAQQEPGGKTKDASNNTRLFFFLLKKSYFEEKKCLLK